MSLILAIALAAFPGPSLTNVMVAIGVSAAPVFVRSAAQRQGGRRCQGAARSRQFAAADRVGQILPNIIALLIVDSSPWMAITSGVSIFPLVLSFDLLDDGLRDALDPCQR